MIPCSVVAQNHFFFYIPLKILKLDPCIAVDGIMDLINIIIDAFIHRLDPAGDQNLTVKLPGFISADQMFQFFNQRLGLTFGDKSCGLDRIYQKL